MLDMMSFHAPLASLESVIDMRVRCRIACVGSSELIQLKGDFTRTLEIQLG